MADKIKCKVCGHNADTHDAVWQEEAWQTCGGTCSCTLLRHEVYADELTALREAVKSATEHADFYTAVDEFLDAEKHPADALLRWHRTRTERKEGT